MTAERVQQLKSIPTPAPKFKRGDIVKIPSGKLMMVHSQPSKILKTDESEWVPQYLLCPLTIKGKPHQRLWNNLTIFTTRYVYSENSLSFIQ